LELQPSRSRSTVSIILVLVIIILAAVSVYNYESSAGSIAGLQTTVTSQQTQINQQIQQLAAGQSKIANLTSTISSLTTQVSSLQNQVNTDNAQITKLEEAGANANVTIESLTSQVSSLESSVSSLNSEISSLNAQITTLSTQLVAEEAMVSNLESFISIADLALTSSTATNLVSDAQISVPANGAQNYNFQSVLAGGYLLVGIENSTSKLTTVSLKGTDSPVVVGNSGVAAFFVTPSTPYLLSVYSGDNSSFTAVFSAWYFHN